MVSQKEQLDNEKEELKRKIYEKTIMRKHLLKIFFKKFKVKENIEVLKTPKQPEKRIDKDKFLCKIKGYRKKITRLVKNKKENFFKDNSIENSNKLEKNKSNNNKLINHSKSTKKIKKNK